MENLSAALVKFPVFLLIAFRIGGILFTSPVFGSRYLPTQMKAGFSLLLAMILLPLVPAPALGSDTTLFVWAAEALKELAVGLILGYAANLVLVAVQLSGQLLDIEVGFAIVNIVDPHTGQSAPLIANYQQILAMLIFLLTNAHHYFLAALARSFQIIPVGGAVFGAGLNTVIVNLFAGLFVTAVKLSVPILAALFLTNVALGVMAKAVPQMNLFSVGLPIKLAVGLAALAAGMPLFVNLVVKFFGEMIADLNMVMSVMGSAVR